MVTVRVRCCFWVFLLAALGSTIGCGPIAPTNDGSDGVSSDGGGATVGDSADSSALSDDALPDFSLTDVNANSARYQDAVSPREYLGKISAWYFGHAT